MTDYFAHETACIDPGAQIGEGTKIWHFSHVMPKAKIGKNCSLGQNVYVANNVVIGDGCKIQNNVSLYEGVVIEDYVFCGPSVVFTNVYNPRAYISRKDEYRLTYVQKGATLGANCTIICGVTISQYSFIGAGAVVKDDVKSHALMVGIPARQIGWISCYGERLNLPLEGEGTAVCPITKEQYILLNSTCLLKKAMRG